MATSDSIEKILLASAALDDPTHHYLETAALTQVGMKSLSYPWQRVYLCDYAIISCSPQEAIIVLLAEVIFTVSPG